MRLGTKHRGGGIHESRRPFQLYAGKGARRSDRTWSGLRHARKGDNTKATSVGGLFSYEIVYSEPAIFVSAPGKQALLQVAS